MGNLIQDLKYGLRMLAKNPGFTSAAVLTLALGIGANAAIFQLLDAVRIRTLPVRNPQQLALIQLANRTGWRGSQESWNLGLTNPLWERVRDHPPSAFSGLFAWAGDDFNLAPNGEVRHSHGLWVSGDFFNVLGVRPIRGRVFTPQDDQRGCGLPGAVVSYAFWQGELGGDAEVIGRKITLNDDPVTIIGVTPANFTGLEVGQSFDVALPICSQSTLGGQESILDEGTIWWLTVMGRLSPGWSLERATAELAARSPGIFEATLPSNYPRENVKDYLRFHFAAYPAGTGISWLRQQYEDPLWFLLATGGLVLLIACANLANLMLARASAREREIAVRLALGASRRRLVRQLMAESLLLAAFGAGLGLFMAGSLSQLLISFLSTEGGAIFLDLHADWRVLGFTTAVAVVTCLFFGLTPALQATGIAPGTAMKAGGRGLTTSRERFTLRRALVASQVALSFVLLVGALLFSRSLYNLMSINAGFRQDGIIIAFVDMTRLKIPVARRIPFKLDLLDRLRAIPGVDSAADVGFLPLGGGGTENRVWAEGSDRSRGIDSNFDSVSHDYFKTLETPLLEGRDFDSRDTPTSPPVAIVNQSCARLLGLGANPVGKRFLREATPYDPEMAFEIIGLVADTKYRNIRRDFGPIAFLAMAQYPRPDLSDQILIRSKLPPADLTNSVRRSVAEANPGISSEFRVFKTVIRDGLLRERLMATLSGFFGFLAGVLTAVGLYGVISYLVARRTNEIGVRMALGAQQNQVLRMILGETLWLALFGAVAGLVGILAGGRVASSLLFGLNPADPVTIGAGLLLILALCCIAGYLPARRAAQVDPMVALRYE